MASILHREKQISVAEDRLQGDHEPTTVDDFEKQIKTYPNDSFNWIKYMDFMISMADVEEARKIAERYIHLMNYDFVFGFLIITKYKLVVVNVDLNLYNPKLLFRSIIL